MNIEDLSSQYWESTLHGTSLASWLAQDLAAVLLLQEGGEGFPINSYPETKSANPENECLELFGAKGLFSELLLLVLGKGI